MATTSNSGSGQKHSASSSSRFGSLKVFKFAAVSSKNSPPIPPPKEKPPTNSSFVSLTAESSTPTTPVSPDYSRSQSTPPYPPTHSPAPSSQDPASASSSSSTSFGRGLIKFAKRSLTPKSVTRQLSEPSEDGSISMPWNFQHNMHVDEGYNGLPPSWVASLATMGYSEEEIEAISYRRSSSRAQSTIPFQHPNFPSLSSTSQLSIITTTTQNARDRVTPSPSMRRQPSQASTQSRGTRRTRKMSTETARSRQSFYQSSSANDSAGDLTYVTDDFPPPLPSKPPAQLNGHAHIPKKSVDTLASGLTSNGQSLSPITRSKSPQDFPPTSSQTQLRSRPSQNRTASKDSVAQVGKTAGSMGPPASRPPRTPPRSASQTFRVVNTDALSQSPPPAYHLDDSSPIHIVEKPSLFTTPSHPPQPQQLQPQLRKMPSTRQRQADAEPRVSVLSTVTVTPRSDSTEEVADQLDASGITGVDHVGGEDEEPTSLPPLGLSVSSLSTSPMTPAKKKKRYSLAPPRLSLGQDAFADIGGWGDSLFGSLSTATTAATSVGGGSHPSTGSELGEKRAPVLRSIDKERKPEASLTVGDAGLTFLDIGKEERVKKELSGLTLLPSPFVSPAATTQGLPSQKTYQPSQPCLPQPQASAQSQTQLGPTPPPKAPPIIPLPQPPVLSTSTSSSSSTSTSSSNPPSTTHAQFSTTKTVDVFPFPKPPPEPARGRAEPHPPKSADSSLPRTSSATSISNSQSHPPRERSSSRASAHRFLPPQKPLPTLSLMSPIPLPNPPSHVELKSKISVVSLKAAAKRDKEREKKDRGREKETGEEEEHLEKVEGVGKVAAKKDERAKAMEVGEEGRWPMTAKETVQLISSINHENDGLDFGEQRKIQDGPVSALTKTNSISLDPQHSHDVRDPHLSVDGTQFDPNRLSSTSAGSRGSTRSSSGGGLKLVFRGSDCHNEYRDSNVSTSTITHATIVSGPVEVLTRARADLVVSPGTPVTRTESDPAEQPSPAMLDVTPPPELTGGSSRETTPKQASPPLSNVDAMGEGRLHGWFEGRSPSPDSSTNSHSSSSATTSSCTGPASLNSANRAAGFPGPAIKHHSCWEGEEGARRAVVSSSPLASPYKSEFGRSDEGEEDDEEEEEEAVVTVVNPPSGSRKGSVAGLMDEITGQRRPSLAISPISSYSLMTREPHSNAASVSQLLSPLNGTPQSAGSGGSSPAQRYPGWLSNVLSKIGLQTFVDEKIDPREYFEGLTEVAEGESGFVYQAKVVRAVPGSKLTKRGPQPGGVVAIKAVSISPSGSTKLEDLRREVEVMKRVSEDDRPVATSPQFSSASGHPAGMAHVLLIEAMYVDLQEDSLWIRMELMERSLADVVALVEEGHMERLDEKVVARFASDVVQALSYLHSLGIAHRDVRSDNLLLNREGVMKIADFSNAVTATPNSPMCTGLVGVIYWQAPEVRVGAYNPMKADVWSLGATIWEMAESTPPFHDAISAADLRDRWPPLTRAGEFSRSLHDFLTLCSNPVASRPDSSALLQTPFVRNVARRSAVIQILKKCRTIENLLAGSRPSVDSQGTFSRR